jgi:hypothetical protein
MGTRKVKAIVVTSSEVASIGSNHDILSFTLSEESAWVPPFCVETTKVCYVIKNYFPQLC